MATNAAARVTRRQRAELLRDIYVIVNEDARAIELAQAVLTAGVRILQYRAKTGLSATGFARCARSRASVTRCSS